MRPFQFLLGVGGTVDRRSLIEGAKAAESIGYSGLAIHDHLSRQFAPVPALTAVATATERLRLYPLVLNNDLRHPAVLAQELATLDVISEGRTVVGIGAGWNAPEYVTAGITFDPPGKRIERMEEAVAVLRGLLSGRSFTFHGRFYAIENMEGQPHPVQRPYPPFLIGGTRERLLKLAAREADIVGVDLRQDRASLPDAFPARMDVRIGWVREAAGPRFESLDINVPRVVGELSVTSTPLRAAAEVARRYLALTGLAVDPADILASPYSLIGTVGDIVDKLKVNRARWGINSLLVGWLDEPTLASFAPVVEQLGGT